MNVTHPYQFESEEPLQDEEDSDCFEKAESSKKTRGAPGTLNFMIVILEILVTILIITWAPP